MLKLKPYSVSVEDAETKEQIPLTAIKGEQGLPGQPGRDGRDGQDGQPGQDGYTPVKGVDYYTDAEKSALETEVQGVVESNIQGTLDDIQDKVDEVEAIAKGRSAGYVFDTEDAMTTWVAAHSDELNLGDNLYIRATDVPDYWWDGSLVQPLETQKVDLTEYAKTSAVNTELGKKQDKLTAGTNITISGTTISAKSDSTKQDKLTAGTNITISGTTISAKPDTTKQDKLVSGTNIKTVNGESLLGSGNIEIKGGGSGDGTVDSTVAIDVIPPSSDPEYINVQNELDGIKEEIAHIDEVIIDTVEPLQKQADATDRSLDALWKLNKGQTYDIEQKTENGMSDAPSGAEFMSLEEVYGKSEQDTYQGYNLIPNKATSVTKGDISYTVLEDKSIVINGTASSGGTNDLYLYGSSSASGELLFFDIGEYSRNPSLSEINLYFRVINDDGTTSAINNPKTLLAEKPLNVYGIFVRLSSGKTYDNVHVYPMFEKGSVIHDYEPYVGNEPSPSPEYPQEIRSITELHFSHEGANLFESITSTKDLITLVNSSGQTRYGKLISGLKEQVYIKPFSEAYDKNLYIARFDGDTITSISSISASGVKITDLSDFAIISNVSNKTDTLTRLQSADLMMVYGDTAPTYYEPYSKEEKVIIPPFPMNAIGSGDNIYRDMLDVENGVWKWKNASVKFLDLTWAKNTSSGSKVYFSANVKLTPIENYAPTLCDRFNNTTWVLGTEGVYVQSTGQIVVLTKRYNSVGDFISNNGEAILVYPCADETTEPINSEDLEFLRSLELTPADHHITVTDQNGNDIEWLAEYIISLREVH